MNVRFTTVPFARKVPDACSSFSSQLIKVEQYGPWYINMTLQRTVKNTFFSFYFDGQKNMYTIQIFKIPYES